MRKLLCWFLGHVAPSAPLASGQKPIAEHLGDVDCWDVFKCSRCGHLWELHVILAEEDAKDAD